MGGATPAGAGFALAACAFFLSYEPAVVLSGMRGARARRELGPAARRWLSVCAAGALLTAPAPARLLVAVPAVLAVALVPVVWSGRVKTLAAEVAVAAALAAMHLPLAASGGIRGPRLWAPAAVWFVASLVAILEVHAIKARLKGRHRWIVAAAAAGALAGTSAAVALAVACPALRPAGVALLAPAGAVLVIHVMRLHPRRLKAVGWAVVAADVAALLVLVLW